MTLQVGLPAESYTSDASWQRDRERLVMPGWWVVAHHAEVPDTGDAIPFEIAGVPMLVVNDGGGRIRVFLNACRHRAGPPGHPPCPPGAVARWAALARR